MRRRSGLLLSMMVAGLAAACQEPTISGSTGMASASAGASSTGAISSTTGAGSSAGTTSASTSGTAAGSSTGGNSTGGTTGSSTGGTTGSYCDAGDLPELYNVCPCGGGDCIPPDVCAVDPVLQLWDALPTDMICEMPCQTNDDCVNDDSRCTGGGCVYVSCGADSGNGTYNGTCSIDGGFIDATCRIAPTQGGEVGACELAGPATGTCNSDAFTRELAKTGSCIPGWTCYDYGSVNGKELDYCAKLCDPTAPNPCPAGLYCNNFLTTPPSGRCEDAGPPGE